MTAKAGSPVAHLHLRAQILLMQAYALSIGGPGLAWGGWAVGYAGEELAVGAGTLSVVLGVRWAVGRWERAKRRWWESWTRVDEGLERDLQVSNELRACPPWETAKLISLSCHRTPGPVYRGDEDDRVEQNCSSGRWLGTSGDTEEGKHRGTIF